MLKVLFSFTGVFVFGSAGLAAYLVFVSEALEYSSLWVRAVAAFAAGFVAFLVAPRFLCWAFDLASKGRGSPSRTGDVSREDLARWMLAASDEQLSDLVKVKCCALDSGMPHKLATAHSLMVCYQAANGAGAKRETGLQIVAAARSKFETDADVQAVFEREMADVRRVQGLR